MTHKNSKKYRNFMFKSAECSLLWAECFSCSLDVVYGGLGIRKFAIFDQKNISLFQLLKFLIVKTLDTDPDWYSA